MVVNYGPTSFENGFLGAKLLSAKIIPPHFFKWSKISPLSCGNSLSTGNGVIYQRSEVIKYNVKPHFWWMIKKVTISDRSFNKSLIEPHELAGADR